MKTREEIEAIALELYPESPNFFGMDTNKTRRDGFIKGYELCQQNQTKCGFCGEPKKKEG